MSTHPHKSGLDFPAPSSFLFRCHPISIAILLVMAVGSGATVRAQETQPAAPQQEGSPAQQAPSVEPGDEEPAEAMRTESEDEATEAPATEPAATDATDATEQEPVALDPMKPEGDATLPTDQASAPEQSGGDLEVASETTAENDGLLRFAFEGVPWRDVIKWLADESELALHVGDVPTGSFTYSDPDAFTPQEAIDRVNLFLLPQGFALVRSGKLLSVLNLVDPRSMQQLDALAKLVSVEELDQLNDHEVVKCFFPLEEFDAEDAVDELSALKLMTDPAVFTKTNRLLITDTVAKLRSVKSILDAFQPSTLDDGTVMKNFALQHVDAEDILLVARPHLGLATGEMIGIDVSLSADLQGKNIFVTGVEDKVTLIEGLIEALDIPEESLSSTDGEAELRSHVVEGGNVEIVYNVLQTLLAGKSVRLSMDDTADSIVALATPEIQEEIAETVAELQASEAEFEVITLKWIDPYFAVSLLEEMLDLAEMKKRATAGMEALSRHGNSRVLDMESDTDVPKIDADPGNMRLYVRAKKSQMELIKEMVAELDVSSNAVESSDEMRLFPLTGKQAEQALEMAARFWRGENLIILYEPMAGATPEVSERVVADEPGPVKPAAALETDSGIRDARILAGDIQSQAPAIRCQLTPRGLVLQSDDTEALDKFCEQLRTIAGPTDVMPSPPVVFYLKYTRPDEALRMLAELLDGGESAKEADAGTLVNGYVSSGSTSGFLGSIVTSREGTMTMIAGTVTVVADVRLNRLIAQGTASDIELIESYLKIVDKDSSITSIETYGSSHVIELVHTPASEVAAAIREAYAGRVTGVPGSGQNQQGQQPQPGQREAAAAQTAMAAKSQQWRGEQGGDKRPPERRSGGSQTQSSEPKLTIAVHEPSNSLIVTAPEQLFNEVEALAKMIDSRNEQAVDVLQLSNPSQVEFLQQFLSDRRTGTGGRPTPPRSPTIRPPSSPSRVGR